MPWRGDVSPPQCSQKCHGQGSPAGCSSWGCGSLTELNDRTTTVRHCFPGRLGGSVVRHPHASAGDMGRSLTRKTPHATAQCCRAWEPYCRVHASCSSRSAAGGPPTMRTRELQLESGPCSHDERVAPAWATREKPAQQQRPSTNKNKLFSKFLSVFPKIKCLPEREEITLFVS